MAHIGEIIDGKYEVLREIGRGGMSVVYLAMDKRLNKQWAIKEFRKDKDDESNQIALKALLREAEIMKKLDHPTLPRIVDIVDIQTTVYVIMDYIEGESLNRVLDAYGAQPQEAVIEWAKQLSEVLDYLHTQSPPVIYRDMKPANIMLKPDGTVRLIDFGIAREYKEGKEGDTETVGTRGYAAPEQCRNDGQTDARTDIYSLGVTLYHLVTGKNPAEPPYEIYPIRHWNPSLSSGLEWLIQKCTQLNPDDRYQSCAEVTYVLDNLDKFDVAYKRKQKSKINVFIITVVLTVIFGIASLGFFMGANQMKKTNIDALMGYDTVEGYAEVLNVDDSYADAYVKLVERLRSQITDIKPGSDSSESENYAGSQIMDGDIYTWFSNERLKKLKEEDLPKYIYVNYELGRLYWNCFRDASDGDTTAIRTANVYFGNSFMAVDEYFKSKGINKFEDIVAYKDEAGNVSVFTEKKYNLAKAYYLVSYFQSNTANLSNTDDGDFVADEKAKAAGVYGVDENNIIKNTYYSFWQTNKKLLELLSGDNDISDSVRLDSLKRLAYIVTNNYSQFYSETVDKTEKVDGNEMKEMYNMFADSLSNISDSDKYKQQIDEIKEILNKKIPEIDVVYGMDLEEVK